jgi:hypothetical protein
MKIQIVSIARSGSRYLKELLVYHLAEEYQLHSEPFNDHRMPAYSKKYVGKIIKKCNSVKNVLLKTHINDLYRIENQTQQDYFFSSKWYKILLLRKDLFGSTLSHMVALELSNFNTRPYLETTLEISVDKFVSLLYTKIEHVEKMAQLKSRGLFNQIIYYEDFTFEKQTDLSLFKFNIKQCNQSMPETKTPNNILTIVNRDALYKSFLEETENYKHPLVSVKSGFFELV